MRFELILAGFTALASAAPVETGGDTVYAKYTPYSSYTPYAKYHGAVEKEAAKSELSALVAHPQSLQRHQ